MINPFSFRPGPVTFWTTVTYLALLIPIVIINEEIPPTPSEESPLPGLNLTQAWLDLTTLTRAYHPYNSHYNDHIREYLLQRISSILDENGVSWVTDGTGSDDTEAAVTVFDDLTSNCTILMSTSVLVVKDSSKPQIAAYFEGTNILVYIRGKADSEGKWWQAKDVHDATRSEQGLTLVNAHYDSVATGYGATDDGMGVATCLQLIQYFTHPSHQPEHGIVVLLNNGEEDYLYGARALGQHPLNAHIHTFLNLEGAGAGGRAILFRTTDREVTAAYAGSPNPFGTVIGSDAFGLGFIRSGTDYSVLYDVYGQRGLDLAFFNPRARYHTNQDDARHASRGSLWHMLSASVHTAGRLAGDNGGTFVGPRPDAAGGKVRNGSPSDGVWFDLFGKGFVLFGLRGLFAWSLTVLVVTPLVLVLVTYLLHRADRYYLFSASVKAQELGEEGEGEGVVPLGGWKGFFRFPLALLVAGSLTLGAAFLMRKVNPFIIYGSRYSVLAMMVSLFYFSFWAIMRGANFVRPSALHRIYVQIWLFVLGWGILVAVTVAEDRLRIAAGYLFVFLQSSVFLALLIALLELFVLPKKADWSIRAREEQEARNLSTQLPPPIPNQGPARPEPDVEADDADDAPTERTPLVGGNASGTQNRTTFATTYRRSISALVNGARGDDDGEPRSEAFEHEQAWSSRLPSWTWMLQFLLLGPFTIILVGQIALVLVDAVHQTGSDGSSLILPYLIAFLCTVLLLLPLAPFIHRVTHHVPLFLLAVFVGTLIYNLAAFPFSAGNRYKAFFVQRLDLDNGTNTVCFDGIEPYVRGIIAELPSAAGAPVECGESRRGGVVSCCFDGARAPPRLRRRPVAESEFDGTDARLTMTTTTTINDDIDVDVGGDSNYTTLVRVNATRTGAGAARLTVAADNTKACFVEFARPVARAFVQGSSGLDERFGRWPDGGVTSVRLWHREWDREWVVDVEWKEESTAGGGDGDGDGNSEGVVGIVEGEGESEGGEDDLRRRGKTTATTAGLAGTVVCMWSDASVQGTIPALDEALAFAPAWAAVTKLSEGLVEARKGFEV